MQAGSAENQFQALGKVSQDLWISAWTLAAALFLSTDKGAAATATLTRPTCPPSSSLQQETRQDQHFFPLTSSSTTTTPPRRHHPFDCTTILFHTLTLARGPLSRIRTGERTLLRSLIRIRLLSPTPRRNNRLTLALRLSRPRLSFSLPLVLCSSTPHPSHSVVAPASIHQHSTIDCRR